MTAAQTMPDWIDSVEARLAIEDVFGVELKQCKLIQIPRLIWNVQYEITPHSGIYKTLSLRLVDLGYEDGYWCMEYAPDINTLFFRVYEG